MKTKRMISLLLAMVLCVSVLTACGGQDTTGETTQNVSSNELAYRVSVVDALGNPYTDGIIVSFTGENGETAMQKVNESGIAEKTLTKGTYAVELMFTGDESAYHYEATELKVTADAPELQVVLDLAVTGEGRTLYAPAGECQAYPVVTGCTYVTLKAGERNYYLFAPTTEGTYEISVIGDVEAIGYFGSPHFVQENNVGDVTDNVITVSITGSMIGTGDTGTTVLVLGVDAGAAESAVLTIQRVGAHQWTVEDEPWMVYEPTVALAPYTLPGNAVVKEFDLTAEYTLVLNEADGFYHLDSADGPLVLARLAEPSKYLDSFKTILENTAIRRYFFDANGEFLKKEEYSNCVLEYLQYVDENAGVYPLTEDLKYIIQQHGEYAGWYDYDGGQYLFLDANGNRLPGINAETSWLFTCCYIENE